MTTGQISPLNACTTNATNHYLYLPNFITQKTEGYNLAPNYTLIFSGHHMVVPYLNYKILGAKDGNVLVLQLGSFSFALNIGIPQCSIFSPFFLSQLRSPLVDITYFLSHDYLSTSEFLYI